MSLNEKDSERGRIERFNQKLFLKIQQIQIIKNDYVS